MAQTIYQVQYRFEERSKQQRLPEKLVQTDEQCSLRKTMENVRKHIDVKLITSWIGRYGAQSYIGKPNFHSAIIFNENFVAIEMEKLEVYMSKPVYIGQAILDISKIKLYDFDYDYMKETYNDNCKLMYTDTDSLIYEIRKQNVYHEIRDDELDRFDTSDYPSNNQFGIKRKNAKVLGIMKDECCGKIVTEIVCLRSKLYALCIEYKDYVKKAKGVKSCVMKNIEFQDYLDCLFKNNLEFREQ